MNVTGLYFSKAEKYARYRWQYAPQSIQTIFDWTGITNESWLADLGAGTGILTREFVGKVGRIFAVEPDPAMRAIAAQDLSHYPSCQVIAAQAEATTLDDHSIDLVTAAQAVHWFEPQATRKELIRILKPGGWLAILRNYSTDHELGKALKKIYPIQFDTSALMVGKNVSEDYYFEKNSPLKFEFPIQSRLSWKAFLGALLTASYAPGETDPAYVEFARGARQVFDWFARDDFINQTVITQLYLGKVARKDRA